LGMQLKVSHMMVVRVWAKHGLKPQRLDRYTTSSAGKSPFAGAKFLNSVNRLIGTKDVRG
jgi:hypothetical protein